MESGGDHKERPARTGIYSRNEDNLSIRENERGREVNVARLEVVWGGRRYEKREAEIW